MYRGGSKKKNELINEFIVNVAEVDQRKRHKNRPFGGSMNLQP